MDKKPSVDLLIGIGKGHKPEAEEEKDSSASDWEAMASEVLDAIESKDAAGLAEALRAFCEACCEPEPEAETSEEE